MIFGGVATSLMEVALLIVGWLLGWYCRKWFFGGMKKVVKQALAELQHEHRLTEDPTEGSFTDALNRPRQRA